jgi:hypothetical protein
LSYPKESEKEEYRLSPPFFAQLLHQKSIDVFLDGGQQEHVISLQAAFRRARPLHLINALQERRCFRQWQLRMATASGGQAIFDWSCRPSFFALLNDCYHRAAEIIIYFQKI